MPESIARLSSANCDEDGHASVGGISDEMGDKYGKIYLSGKFSRGEKRKKFEKSIFFKRWLHYEADKDKL